MKKSLDRILRRIAQRLSPILTEGQVRELRRHYCCGQNGHASGSDELTYNINVGNYGQSSPTEVQKRAYQQAIQALRF